MTPLPASKVTNFHRPMRNYAWFFIYGSLPAWRKGRGAALAVGSWAVERPMSLLATPVCALRAFGGWCAERPIRQIENERRRMGRGAVHAVGL